MPAVSATSVLAPAPASPRSQLCYSTETRRGALSLRPARAIPALRLVGHRDARGAVVVRAAAAEVCVATGTYRRSPEADRVLTGRRCFATGSRGSAGQSDDQVLLRRGGRRGARGPHRHRVVRRGRT